MLKRNILLFAVLAAALPFHADARADVIVMKNGDRITGAIKRVWDEELFIEPAYADEFPVELREIAYIESDQDFDIELRDNSTIQGRFEIDEEGNMILITAEGTSPFTPSAIKELEELDDEVDWLVRSDFLLNATRGNTHTSDYLWQGYGSVEMGDHRHVVDAKFNQKAQDGVATKEENNISYIYSWFFADRWFLSGGVGFDRDPIRELRYRYTPGAGIGFRFFEDADRHFEVSLSAVGVREEIGGVTNESAAARWGLRYQRDLLGGDMEFFHNHRLWRYVTGRRNTVADTTTGFRWDVWRDIYFNVQLDWDWESDPAPGNEQEDLTFAVGIGVELE
jgi:hypothetical protein